MKNFKRLLVIISIVIGLFIASPWAFAKNDKLHIEQSYLIEKYLIEHKQNIDFFAKKYKFQNSKELKEKIQKLDSFIQSLRSLQNDWEKSWVNISILLKDIKQTNEWIRVLLLNKKKEYSRNLKEKIKSYEEIGKVLSKQLDSVYLKMYNDYKKEESILSPKEQKVKNSLKAINILSKEMSYFWLKEFDTEEEMQTSFLWALNSIKHHILVIKQNLK